KSQKELVSNVDMKCQQLSYDLLTGETRYPILSEEIRNTTEIAEDYCWIVDPLDGSHNFISGLPAFGVSIALVKNRKSVVGVLYLPFYDMLYSAIKGRGAYMNGQKICVSTNNNLEKSMITYDNMFHTDINIIKRFEKIIDRSFTVRITGSAIYDFSLIASGKIDSRVWNNTKMYDFSAGGLIIEEAGGKITNFKGKPITLKTKDIIASNGLVHNEIISIINQTD
nr:inositol monophosphatase [Bacteroidota bacterium]